MSFLSGAELENALKPSLGAYFSPKRIKEAAYELSLGNQVYRTDSETRQREILDDRNSQVIINPGQFALLITEETIEIPLNLLGLISIKFSEKIKGLLNVSGFHVDPGFKGKIIFSVYNAGPSVIILDRGSPYFLIWFSTLTSPVEYKGLHQGQEVISAKLIEQLKGELASPSSLLSQIKEVDKKLEIKTNELNSKKDHNRWLLKAVAVLLAGLWVGEIIKNNNIEEGYRLGYNQAMVNEKVNIEIKKANIDSILRAKTDSIRLKIK